jgi:hypothetical protein
VHKSKNIPQPCPASLFSSVWRSQWDRWRYHEIVLISAFSDGLLDMVLKAKIMMMRSFAMQWRSIIIIFA